MSTILTDDEIQAEGRNGFGIDPILDGNLMKFARAVEAAVLTKLEQQKPVAWRYKKEGGGWFVSDNVIRISTMSEIFTPKTLAEEFKARSAEYVPRKIEQIKNEIRNAYMRCANSVWIAFEWADGDYAPILAYFEGSGFEVGSPTGTDDGDFTSYLISWPRPNEDALR